MIHQPAMTTADGIDFFIFFFFGAVFGKQKKRRRLTRQHKANTRLGVTLDPVVLITETFPHKHGEVFLRVQGWFALGINDYNMR